MKLIVLPSSVNSVVVIPLNSKEVEGMSIGIPCESSIQFPSARVAP